MLPFELQEKLAKRYGGTSGLIKEAFEQQLAKAFAVDFEEERREYAAVVLVDIFRFSHVVKKMSPEQIREFLDGYYKRCMPALFDRGGMIDRVAGDGILAVFSPFFTAKSIDEMNRAALQASEAIVKKLAGTAYSSKAAVAGGQLVFCKTGVAGVYEECTVIGGAITRAYRMEEKATENQVVIEATEGFEKIIVKQVTPGPPTPGGWSVARKPEDLRGVGLVDVFVQSLNVP